MNLINETRLLIERPKYTIKLYSSEHEHDKQTHQNTVVIISSGKNALASGDSMVIDSTDAGRFNDDWNSVLTEIGRMDSGDTN